jgi:hypothetical protein
VKLLRRPRLHAPEILPHEWVNGEPGPLAALRGRVILVSFFSWSDPAVVRELPTLEAITARHRSAGLETLGVLVPQEDFERDAAATRDELWRLDLGFPVALDFSSDVSRAYENRTLPGHYLIDREGFVRGWRHGLGALEEIEAAVRFLTSGETAPGLEWMPTPELRLGLPAGGSAGEPAASPGPRTFPDELPEVRAEGVAYFAGSWNARRDRLVAASKGARLAVIYEGADALAVLSLPRDDESPLVVHATLDGDPLRPVTVDRSRAYDLARAPFGVHHLEVECAPGLAFHRLWFAPAEARAD